MATHLALLSGANPRTATRGPGVRLQAGRWKFDCAGLKDTSLVLTLISIDPQETISVQHDCEFDLEHPCIVQISFKNRGNEQTITVAAQKVA